LISLPPFDSDSYPNPNPLMCKCANGRCFCGQGLGFGRGMGMNCPFRQSQSVQENFSNDEIYAFSPAQYSNYQAIPLLSPYDENKNPENLYFGQANRYIIASFKDSLPLYRLEVYCNLPVLGGNVFNNKTTNVIQSYKVFLLNNKSKEKVFLQELKRDGDGIYKMKYITDKVKDMLRYKQLQIVYGVDDKETVLLEGSFQ
jgi:hypothetical protein